jgi:hypothetical protein
LALASEQEAQKFRGYLTAAVEENNSFRLEHRVEIEASKAFRSQQRNALQQSNARQIQKILKEEGTFSVVKRTSTQTTLTDIHFRTSEDPVAATYSKPRLQSQPSSSKRAT